MHYNHVHLTDEKPRFRESDSLAQGLTVFTMLPNLSKVAKKVKCLVTVDALNLKTKPAPFWARDSGQDHRDETRR